jgi:hypothetical protein
LTVPNATTSFQDYRVYFSLQSIKPSSPPVPSKPLLSGPLPPHLEDFSDASLLRKLRACRGGEEDVESDVLGENVERSQDDGDDGDDGEQ